MQNVPNEDVFSSRLLQPRSINIYSRLVCDFSRQQADLCGFAAADNGDSATQQHTDGALAASTSQRGHQSPAYLSVSLRSIDLDYHLQHLSSFFRAEKGSTSCSLFVTGCRAQFPHLIRLQKLTATAAVFRGDTYSRHATVFLLCISLHRLMFI